MSQPFRAVIFDLDGILADSEPWWNQIDAQMLREYGADYHGEYHKDVLGVSYRLAVEKQSDYLLNDLSDVPSLVRNFKKT